MNKTKKIAAALAFSATAISVSACSGDSDSDGGTVNQIEWNCAQIQTTYDVLGPDGTNPEAILYCLSIGELVP